MGEVIYPTSYIKWILSCDFQITLKMEILTSLILLMLELRNMHACSPITIITIR